MKFYSLKEILLLLFAFGSVSSFSQEKTMTLTLEQLVTMANSQSIASFKAKNMYLSNYWSFKSFKANRLPSLSLSMTPLRYNRDFVRRYDSQQNIDVYRPQQTLFSHGNLSLIQNFDWLGGTFFVDSELGYHRNFSDNKFTQYSSVPIRIGYRQQLLGYNPFKWEKRIEPIKYEAAQKELLYNLEQTAEEATSYFFNLAMAQAEHKLAKEKIQSADTLYSIGKERFEIAAIRQSDLMTLRLDKINAENALQTAEISVKRAMFALVSYLNLEKDTKILLDIPQKVKNITINPEEALSYAKKNNPNFLKQKIQILELQQTVDKTKREARFNMGVSASVGFNQVAPSFDKVYNSPLQQDVFAITLSVPILDWGVNKGKYNIAKSNLSVAELSTKQEEIKIEEEILMTLGDFQVQQQIIVSAEEALELASQAYQQTQERFIIGKADINSLTLANDRHQQAQRNYISALRNYWLNYYKIRKYTLFDFEVGVPITTSFNEIR
ncbi:TolC family protein [Capnocytophaga felis]|uniref:Membrane protein n=1 Tax=Capnocytophaga felis TaxID=2267611 RepID=A0A5M4BBT3_9FLAO|nr:TolC family protein [Capnocytophaga felis]GET47041.1 membrane protein [Capnocytophaga felis]GET49592.1 membrane protein [Capnocytophaga felis]